MKMYSIIIVTVMIGLLYISASAEEEESISLSHNAPTEIKQGRPIAPPNAKEIFLYRSAIEFLRDLKELNKDKINKEEEYLFRQNTITILDTWLASNTLRCQQRCPYPDSDSSRCYKCIVNDCAKLPLSDIPKCVACCIGLCCR